LTADFNQHNRSAPSLSSSALDLFSQSEIHNPQFEID